MSDFEAKSDVEFSWAAHPAAERPRQAALAVGVILAVAALVWSSSSLAWAAGVLVVLVASLNRFFFRSRFTITSEGIDARYPLARKHARWRDLRRFACDDHGGYLSSRPEPSRLDAYRGIHILFSAVQEQRDAAIKRIRSQLAQCDASAKHDPASRAAHGAHGRAAA